MKSLTDADRVVPIIDAFYFKHINMPEVRIFLVFIKFYFLMTNAFVCIRTLDLSNWSFHCELIDRQNRPVYDQ